MLKSFQISNFRLFEKLEVKKLGKVNLIVGKNNSGKSTFLEAIRIYASNASFGVLLDLVEARQESWMYQVQKSQSIFANSIRHLFFGHQLPSIDEKGISLGEVNSNLLLNLYIALYRNSSEDELRKIRVHDVHVHEELSNFDVFLIAEEGQTTRRLFRLDIDISSHQHNTFSGFRDRQDSTYRYEWQTVSTNNMPNRKLATLWDLTGLTDLEVEVISAMGLIDSRISGIAFVGGSNDERIPLVKLKGVDEPLPLKSMGDGMTRIFHIVVALVNAKNGILLIDEFENGLHWTVQPKVWDIIFQLAERLNVQIFTTTHSRDCVQAFEKIWNKYPESGAFFRLDEKNGKIKATEYTLETLADSLEMDVEVR